MKLSAPTLAGIAALFVLAVAWPGIFISARHLLADIGVGVSVPPNAVNTYMQQLDERAKVLDARESAMNGTDDPAALWIALSIIGGLVAVNFILDWRKNRV